MLKIAAIGGLKTFGDKTDKHCFASILISCSEKHRDVNFGSTNRFVSKTHFKKCFGKY